MTHNQWGYPPPPPNYNLYYGAQQPPPWTQPMPQSKRGIRKAIREAHEWAKFLEEMKKSGEKKEEKKEHKKHFIAILAVVWFISPWLVLGYAKLFLWAFSLH